MDPMSIKSVDPRPVSHFNTAMENEEDIEAMKADILSSIDDYFLRGKAQKRLFYIRTNRMTCIEVVWFLGDQDSYELDMQTEELEEQ